LDAYEFKARLAPITVVAAPLATLGVALLGAGAWRSGIGILVGVSGLHVLLMQFVRDRGFAQQDRLFKQWGGPPTVRLLRWSGASNSILVEHRHQEVSQATGVQLPSAAVEASDPDGADQRYEAAITILRDRTRTDEYSLVLRQNAAYGFRRNLYGCKPIGILVAVCTAAVGLVVVLSPVGDTTASSDSWVIAASVFSLGWAAMWAVGVTAGFVRRAAEQYAHSLVEAAGRV
jgi:hypothetical protein